MSQEAIIAKLERELDEMTLALSQAWDQLVPLLQDTPPQTNQDIITILDSVLVALDVDVTLIYLSERDEWYVTPPIFAVSSALKQAIYEALPTMSNEQPFYRTNELVRWMGVPLIIENKSAGLVGIGTPDKSRTFSALDVRILKRLAERIVGQIVASRLALSREHEAKLAHEFEIANTVQRSTQPLSMPHIPQLQVASFWKPAHRVGGDAWGWVIQPDGTLCCFLVDVAGKGLPAALAAVSLHTAIRMGLKIGMTPAEVITSVNSEFYEAYTATDLLATATVIAIHPHTRRFIQANAGHPPTLIHHQHNWLRLEATVPPIGVFEDLTPLHQEHTLQAGDCIICYSDGFIELETQQGLWGETGLLDAIGEDIQDANRIITNITQRANEACLSQDKTDDQTLLVIRFE